MSVKRLRAELDAWLGANNNLLRGDAKFYSKDEWEDRGECIGKKSVLTLTIEGSPLYAALNYGEPSWDYEEQLLEIAKKHGYYYEQGCAWSVHFYPL